ncbi:MAG TPA: hypothetical protein VHZ52_15365 [Acidobacteriaceae bacterium]|jgi:hypothetical protein|nr:hypothetical protein [Acidobacteriaceae bacterium]
MEQRANPHIEAMSQGTGRCYQDGGLERLRADASGTGGISERMALASPFSKVDDFVVPSLVKDGKVPIRASTFVQDHLRPAAISAGVFCAKGQRFGLHNLRHSLST